MTNKQDQWIDDILGSLKNVRQAESNPHLHTRVMAKLQEPFSRKPLQLKWVYAFSAIFAIMLLVNVWGWSDSTDVASTQTVDIETVINEYALENNYTTIP